MKFVILFETIKQVFSCWIPYFNEIISLKFHLFPVSISFYSLNFSYLRFFSICCTLYLRNIMFVVFNFFYTLFHLFHLYLLIFVPFLFFSFKLFNHFLRQTNFCQSYIFDTSWIFSQIAISKLIIPFKPFKIANFLARIVKLLLYYLSRQLILKKKIYFPDSVKFKTTSKWCVINENMYNVYIKIFNSRKFRYFNNHSHFKIGNKYLRT